MNLQRQNNAWYVHGINVSLLNELDTIQEHCMCDTKKVHLVKAVVFPVVTYECESWTEKKAEH